MQVVAGAEENLRCPVIELVPIALSVVMQASDSALQDVLRIADRVPSLQITDPFGINVASEKRI